MIKLKKIVATVLAAAMCLGMGLTASAAVTTTGDVYWDKDFWNSPNYPYNVDQIGTGIQGFLTDPATGELVKDPNGNPIGGFWFNNVTDQYGTSIDWQAKELPSSTLKSINSETKVRDLLKGAGYDVKDNWDLVPVAAFTVDLDEAIDSDGAYAWFDAAEFGINAEGYSAGQSVYVLRETYAGSGEWDVVEAKLEAGNNGRLQARVQLTNRSQSLVAVRVMEDGRTVRLINKKTGASVVVPADKVVSGTSTSTSASATASPQASPKTGEF